MGPCVLHLGLWVGNPAGKIRNNAIFSPIILFLGPMSTISGPRGLAALDVVDDSGDIVHDGDKVVDDEDCGDAIVVYKLFFYAFSTVPIKKT